MHVDCGPCVVRNWTKDDQASLLEFANNRNVWRNMTHRFPHPYTEADATSWFGYLAEMPEPTHWAIEIDGRAVGGVGVDLGEGVYEKSGHFGYWLGEPFWGQGVMTATVRTICDKIMSRYGLCRLEAPVFEWNPASMRVLEKCGFIREGILKRSVYKDDQLIDTVLYARTR
jgi:[ribosomal protein S5]-alanine N-acetyltransferase